jgi:hypothetical protein
VDAAEALQLAIIERLHTETETVDAGVAKRGEPLGGGRFWIGLERDLGVTREPKRLAAGGEQPRNFFGLEQGRRAATEEDRVDADRDSFPALPGK